MIFENIDALSSTINYNTNVGTGSTVVLVVLRAVPTRTKIAISGSPGNESPCAIFTKLETNDYFIDVWRCGKFHPDPIIHILFAIYQPINFSCAF
jgi:hypothetical protein